MNISQNKCTAGSCFAPTDMVKWRHDKQLLDEIFVISRIIKVEVRVTSVS